MIFIFSGKDSDSIRSGRIRENTGDDTHTEVPEPLEGAPGAGVGAGVGGSKGAADQGGTGEARQAGRSEDGENHRFEKSGGIHESRVLGEEAEQTPGEQDETGRMIGPRRREGDGEGKPREEVEGERGGVWGGVERKGVWGRGIGGGSRRGKRRQHGFSSSEVGFFRIDETLIIISFLFYHCLILV